MRLPFLCRLVGCRPPRRFTGVHRTTKKFVALLACPRCGRVVAGAAGARRSRREAWRRQWRRA